MRIFQNIPAVGQTAAGLEQLNQFWPATRTRRFWAGMPSLLLRPPAGPPPQKLHYHIMAWEYKKRRGRKTNSRETHSPSFALLTASNKAIAGDGKMLGIIFGKKRQKSIYAGYGAEFTEGEANV